MVSGAQCVITCGAQLMLKWPADSWDSLPLVYDCSHYSNHWMLLRNVGASSLTFGFTNGEGQIWVENVQCVGTESRLIDCPASPLGVHSCDHFEDAGVSCPIPG